VFSSKHEAEYVTCLLQAKMYKTAL